MNEDNNSKRRKRETMSRPYFKSRADPRPECPHIPGKIATAHLVPLGPRHSCEASPGGT